MKLHSKIILAVAMTALVSGCGVVRGIAGGGGGDKKATPTIGNRIDILGTEAETDVDPVVARMQVILPAPVTNADWAQPGGNAAKAPGHITLGEGLARAWAASVSGASNRARLAATPVVSGGNLFVIDTDARVSAFNAKTGARIWTSMLDVKGDGASSVFGGGVSEANGTVYATTGLGDVAAFNAQTGELLWKKRPAGPLRGAPTIALGNVYIMTQDNQIFALRVSDGETQWNEAGPLGASGIFGVAAPAAAQGTVIAGYSTGELAAYRYENGRNVWNDSLSRTTLSTSVSTLLDIDADPVIDRGRVYALGKGGRMAAYELITGQRIWEINIAGIATPVVAGEWVFVLTDDAKLLCVQRSSGKIRWISQLQRYRNEEKRKDAISWRGPVLAGGRLIVASSEGEVWSISPGEGSSSKVFDVKKPVSVPPIVADNMLYLLDDSGTIWAFR